jgi:hypothetical protein
MLLVINVIATVPKKLDASVFDPARGSDDIATSELSSTSYDAKEFMNRHYVPGEMTSLLAMTKKEDWQKTLRDLILQLML